MNIAIIPARGGSKRIPRKNIKNMLGRPLIAYSIEACLKSEIFSNVFVSTDDHEIAEIACEYGAEVPFYRSKSLSDDYTTTIVVIQDFLKEIGSQYCLYPDNVCCVYPTSPLLDFNYITQGLDALQSNDANFAISITKFGHPIQRALKLSGKNIEMLEPSNMVTRTQDLEELYHDAAQFYWGTRSSWLGSEHLFGENCIGIKIPNKLAQDIDTIEDWDVAEQKLKIQKKGF